jgi:hypothetical protein
MKNLLIVLGFLMLTGCVSVPSSQKFPNTTDVLMEAPPELHEIPDGASATEVFSVVIINYGTYHEVANKLKGWQEWYKTQKENYNSNK